MSDGKLSHLDSQGAARMVDVGGKVPSRRRAVARAGLRMSREAFVALRDGTKKGDALQVARIAAIQGAKKTAELIPLCHPLVIDSVEVDFELDEEKSRIAVLATVCCTGKTGVEMEALCAAVLGALTLYDMAKAVDRSMVIESAELLEKDGGKSGPYCREEPGA